MDFRNLFFVLFLKSRRTSTNKNSTHFVHLKISYGQATSSFKNNRWQIAKKSALAANFNQLFYSLSGMVSKQTRKVSPERKKCTRA